MGAALHALCPLCPTAPTYAQVSPGEGVALGRHLTLSGALRVRPEARRDVGFDPAVDRSYVLSRLRVRLTGGTATLRGVLEVQDSRSSGLSPSSPSLRDPADIHQGYLDVGEPGDTLRVRLGRQELAFGAERLISRNDWRNTARSFDAVRVTVRPPRGRLDLLAAAEVIRDPSGLNPIHDRGDLLGAYGQFAPGEMGLRLEPYALRRSLPSAFERAAMVGAERRHTFGTRVRLETPHGLDVTTEVALQGGSVGGRQIGAWFGSAIVAYGMNGPGRPRLSLELTEASGDASASDDRSGTFDPMYPTGHAHLGFADVFAGRNLRDARVGVELEPARHLSLRLDAHGFWLSSPADGLYAPSLRLIVAPGPRNRSTRVGTELDLTVRLRLGPRVQLGGGSGHLFPGAFLRAHTPGGTTRYTYAYVDLDF